MDEVDKRQQQELDNLNAESLKNKATDALQWISIITMMILMLVFNVFIASLQLATHEIEIKITPRETAKLLNK